MKRTLGILALFLALVAPTFARDVVKTDLGEISGKLSSFSDGLVIINAGGTDYTFTRAVGPNYFGDYIKYRKTSLGEATVETNCHLVFVDKYHAKFDTHAGRISIPRYRISLLVLNYNQEEK